MGKRVSRGTPDFTQRGSASQQQQQQSRSTSSNSVELASTEAGSNAAEPRAPTPAMYWSQRKTWGTKPPKMRSQTLNVIGSNIYVFGGWNNQMCYSDVYVLDTETMFWSKLSTTGDAVPPCRAHTATAVGHRLFVFGGGDGTRYFNELYILDTKSLVWYKPRVSGQIPSARRTHTCFYYNGYVYLFGGGDGYKALNDLCRVRTEPAPGSGAYEWEAVETKGGRPFPRGYHTSTLVGSQVVVFGGSDGQECFGDTSLLDLDTMEWSHISIDPPLTRLAHTATLVGMYLFVICGHDGSDYSNQVLMLKLDTLRWETRVIYGSAPIPRGYHACALHDGRLFLHGGYNGHEVFDDLYTLELSSYSYLPQVPEFSIGCHR
ncbi:galactose oxidase [Martensiomyces pterosporus]|nr:galactose oxidase [Martensiomyces pterosporus]